MVTSPFIVVGFPAGEDADVVYIESGISEPELLTTGGVTTLRNAFKHLAEKALPPDDSLAFIAEVAASYK
jgi:hypothetical protein